MSVQVNRKKLSRLQARLDKTLMWPPNLAKDEEVAGLQAEIIFRKQALYEAEEKADDV